ncbi:PREDICTED: lateral signaling target protein 2 homolog [Gavialis gangeticus]|uniref:lateral signaling target protein 2 homolog n=1 Tax=Gavialis gangeticus TaxID=94835 RepID=UPI00092E5528|nr:PREDICTED: lateral signaling target protein 2 homolog [Gavialis gangeticus]
MAAPRLKVKRSAAAAGPAPGPPRRSGAVAVLLLCRPRVTAPCPQRSDPRLLAQFFHADEQVTRVVAEMNCLDAEMDPQQYLALLSQLHLSQVRLLAVLQRIMDECIPTARHSRDYHAKFPEELLANDLGNHLLFAAECLVAGTFLELDVAEGQHLRPLARTLLRSLELVRVLLREQSLSQAGPYPQSVQAALVQFDALFAEFELSYVSSLVTLKSPEELYKQQEIIVLFCETVQRALRLGYLTQEMIDQYEPLLMFTIPRLAIISGLLIYPEGPLSLERQPKEMSRVFSPFYVLLRKIRDLLQALSAEELSLLEWSLCTAQLEEPRTAALPLPLPLPAPPGPAPPQDARGPGTASGCWARPGAGCNAGVPGGPALGGTERGLPHLHRPLSACPGNLTTACDTPALLVPAPAMPSTGWDAQELQPQLLPMAFGQAPRAGQCWGPHTHSPAEGTNLGQIPALPPVPCSDRGPGTCSGPPGSKCVCAPPGTVPHAQRAELRSCYSSTWDMIHTLFICISGVADQLQTNFASDLRSILRTVFTIVMSQPEAPGAGSMDKEGDACLAETGPRIPNCALCSTSHEGTGTTGLPRWVPDSTCSQCSACHTPFTLLRRRHHCRNCGKIFCARCSLHMAPLPHYGQLKPVRVCTHCYTTHLPPTTRPRHP